MSASVRGRRIDIVHRDVEEALDLVGMQVDRYHAVGAHRRDHRGGDLGRDRHARGTGPPVLAGVAEIRDDRGHAGGRGALHRVNHDQKFHEIVRGGGAGRLDYVDVPAADVFHHLDHDLAVAEAADHRLAHGHVQFVSDAAREPQVGVARENHQ
jgi:hypothetical protein